MIKKVKKSGPKKARIASVKAVFDRGLDEMIIKQAARQEEENARRFDRERRKTRPREASAHAAGKSLEHPLSRDVFDQIQQSKGRLDEECRATIDEANTVLDDRLSNSITQRIQAIKKMQSVTQKISQPCGNEKIEWQVADGNQFGTTTLDTIMRSLSKEVIAAERKIAKYRTEHADIDGALQDEAALNSVQRQGIDISTMNLPAPKQDHQDMMKLQVEKEKIKSLIERENDKAANALQDIDMKFSNKCEGIAKMHESFMAMLADDEY